MRQLIRCAIYHNPMMIIQDHVLKGGMLLEGRKRKKEKSMLQTVGAVRNILSDKATHIMRPDKLIVAWLYPIFKKIDKFFIKEEK